MLFNRFKKITSMIIIVALAVTILPLGALAISFSDLSNSHWAFDVVMKLVDDGTINGFQDGTFRPENTVSRAEFVKMIGKGATLRQKDFDDVSSSHWAYDYVMASGFEPDNTNKFNPDIAITRDEVLNLIWTRAGAVTGVVAPSAITSQGSNAEAAAWGYAYGIMIGDDGLNLRLGDTLTRAEAAALIVRSRNINLSAEKINFTDKIDENILKTVFENADLFDSVAVYDADATVTNGELARAMIRVASQKHYVDYAIYSSIKPFDHEYARDLYVLGKNIVGDDKITADYIDKKADVKTAVAAFSHAFTKKSAYPFNLNNKNSYYPDVKGKIDDNMNKFLTFAFNNGIRLNASDEIGADNVITVKQIASLLVQFDAMIGLNTEYVTENTGVLRVTKNTKIRKDLASYPQNYGEYKYIAEALPNSVYSTPFTAQGDGVALCKSVYDFANEYNSIYMQFLDTFAAKYNKNGAKVLFTYYPSLVYVNGNGNTLRVKVTIKAKGSNKKLSDIFAETPVDMDLYNGLEFFCDVVTGQKVDNIIIPITNAKIDKFIF